MRYYLCPGRTDMRKGISSLCGVVHEKMGCEVRNGDVFIFIGSSRKLMKLLHAEDGGMVMYVKRLEAGRFKLPAYDPNCPDLFADQFAGLMQQAEEKRDEAVAEIEKNTRADRRQKKQNRIMMEDLPVLGREVIEPEGIDLSIYKKIGEDVTRIVKHQDAIMTKLREEV